jgi:hypothetical protein
MPWWGRTSRGFVHCRRGSRGSGRMIHPIMLRADSVQGLHADHEATVGVRMRRRGGANIGAIHGSSVGMQRSSSAQDQRGSGPASSLQQGAAPAPRGQPPRKGSGYIQRPPQRPPATQLPPRQGGPPAQNQKQKPRGAVQREQPAHSQYKGPPQEPLGHEKGHEKGDQRGVVRNL